MKSLWQNKTKKWGKCVTGEDCRSAKPCGVFFKRKLNSFNLSAEELLVSQPIKSHPDTVACSDLFWARAHVLSILSSPRTVSAEHTPVLWRGWKPCPVHALGTCCSAACTADAMCCWEGGWWSAEFPAGISLPPAHPALSLPCQCFVRMGALNKAFGSWQWWFLCEAGIAALALSSLVWVQYKPQSLVWEARSDSSSWSLPDCVWVCAMKACPFPSVQLLLLQTSCSGLSYAGGRCSWRCTLQLNISQSRWLQDSNRLVFLANIQEKSEKYHPFLMEAFPYAQG